MQEMGIRLALGASRSRVLRRVTLQALRLILAGKRHGRCDCFPTEQMAFEHAGGRHRARPGLFFHGMGRDDGIALLASLYLLKILREHREHRNRRRSQRCVRGGDQVVEG